MLSIQLSNILAFFKALSDESRLKIIGTLATSEKSVDELARLLDLKAPTVSHHLAKLKAIDLVTMRTEGNIHLYQLNIEPLRLLSREIIAVDQFAVEEPPVQLPNINGLAIFQPWETKVLSDFFEGERLKEIPASRKKRSVILRWLAEQFELDKQYPEKEVNNIILRHHQDFATLRRELIGAGLMSRENGVYWRTPK